MTLPIKYNEIYLPVKYFLSSYRAFLDGRSGIRDLEQHIQQSQATLAGWRILWVGTCAVLRSSIDLFKADRKSCIEPRIRAELTVEWNEIGRQPDRHAIFWEFLRWERDKLLHEYQWRAYEAWMREDGTVRVGSVPLLLVPDGGRPVLLMKGGPFEGRDSIKVLHEAAQWIEDRIFGAIKRAGFDPDEERNAVTFQPRPASPPIKPLGTILGGLMSVDPADKEPG